MKKDYLNFYNINFANGKYCTKSWGFMASEAGAASRQAEIDALQAKLDRIEKFCNDDIEDYQQSEKSAFAEHDRGYFNACCQVLNILKGESK